MQFHIQCNLYKFIPFVLSMKLLVQEKLPCRIFPLTLI
ncbi:unnamed protein product [Amoebophrya sp. A120]|nr:unnamed protein product [Amoebophrya sp. A120]|eukprot:GSA120T00019779001.1